MRRWLIVIGVVLLVAGLLWPWLTRLGLGNLPGDIWIRGERFSFYFPITTCIVLSLVLAPVLVAKPLRLRPLVKLRWVCARCGHRKIDILITSKNATVRPW